MITSTITKQEEIREGIGLILYRVWADGKVGDKRSRTKELRDYLKSKGVVIKVDRGSLPKIGDKVLSEIKSNGRVYVAVEELI